MPVSTFPMVQNGSIQFDNIYNIKFTNVQYQSNYHPVDVTGTFNAVSNVLTGSAGQKGRVITHRLPTVDISASGWMTLESSGTQAAGSLSGYNDTGTLITISAQQYTLRKVWQLFDVTGSTGGTPATRRRWAWGFPTVMGSVVGFAGTGFAADMVATSAANNTITVAIDFDLLGTMTGKLALNDLQFAANYASGGRVPVSFSFIASDGATTFVEDSDNYTWLFSGTDNNAHSGDPSYGLLTFDIDDATDVSERVLLYDVTLRTDMQNGGPNPAQIRMRVDA